MPLNRTLLVLAGAAALAVSSSAWGQARDAAEVLKEINALKQPEYDRTRREDAAYTQEFLAAQEQYLAARAALAKELYESDPSHEALGKLMMERWNTLSRQGKTEEVLAEIGASDVPRLLVLNKIDRSGNEDELRTALLARHPGAVVMSARRPGDVANLREKMIDFFRKGLVEAELFLPWAAQQLRGEIFASCEVLEEISGSEGATFRVRGEPEAVERLRGQAGALR